MMMSTAAQARNLATLQVRITNIDYNLVQSGILDNSSLTRVPVIRIYGASSTGQNACIHVHQVYPYFFVEYTGKLDARDVHSYIGRLTRSLNSAIAMSMKRNPNTPNNQFIRAILLVKGVHFYGFHSSYSPFLKILMVDPSMVTRAVTILQSGTVLQTRFCVFESHLSYLLQFMADFGLYGCGWLNLGEEIWKRGDEDEENGVDASGANAITFKQSSYFRQSRMSLEVDVASHQILNRHQLAARNIHHKLEVPAPPLPSEPLVLSVRELWEDERRRRLAKGLSPTPEIPVDPSDKSRGKGGEWVAEARWWEEIRNRIQRENTEDFGVADGANKWERWVMTTFESVEALWEEPWKVWKPRRDKNEGVGNPYAASADSSTDSEDNQPHAGDVDMNMLGSQEMSHLVERAEEDWQRILEDTEPQQVDEPNDEEGFDVDVDEDLSGVENEAGRPFQDDREHASDPNPFQEDVKSSSTHPATSGQEIELKLARPNVFDFSQFDGPTTPTKNLGKRRCRSASPVRPYTTDKTLATESLFSFPRLEEGAPQLDNESDLEVSSLQQDTLDEVARSGHPDRHQGPEHAAHVDDLDSERRPLKRQRHDGPVYGVSWAKSLSDSLSQESAEDISGASASPKRSIRLSYTLPMTQNWNGYVYAQPPPSTWQLLSSLSDYEVPSKVYRNPYYSKESDAPEKAKEYGGLQYRLKGGDGMAILEPWVNDYGSPEHTGNQSNYVSQALDRTGVGGWEFASIPPSAKETKRWLLSSESETAFRRERPRLHSQIEGPTQAHMDTPETVKTPHTSSRIKQSMTILSLEIFAPSRSERVPNAEEDPIVAIFYSYQDSGEDEIADSGYKAGIIAVSSHQLNLRRLRDFEIDVVPDELELLNKIVDNVVDLDPDIIVGWEIQSMSWGYLGARGRTYGLDIGDLISRAPLRLTSGGADQWGMRHGSTFKVAGRHVLNIWRVMRSERNLNIYTFENVAFHVLKRRFPRYSHSTLTDWYNSASPCHTATVLRYLSDRTSMNLDILEEAEVVTKTAEFARVFGVDFSSVLSRGSQFKVESFMFRIAKPESLVLLSPSKKDVGYQNAAECMPLIMEPLSAFYSSPLVVLDFQSLYPSIMIAYNYCYSTCLGRVADFKGQNKFGVIDLDLPEGLLGRLQDHITVAPNGIMYVKPTVRKGLLGRMLVELLETRIMVKQAMKGVSHDKALRRILDARQLSLKFICNVTYGYTSASFSGRMPAVEIADSIVQSGRETLEKAIRLINTTKKWGAKVVYGDTDSVFVYLRGKTKDQAFRIGHDMADTITALNPTPIKLKFEKVYLPCVLMAKKRYVGYKYENPDDKEAVFDAKGIETVRRDGILAQQKMTENCLKILFRTQNLTQVKEYCCTSWLKILENKVPIQDFIFAKEVRMGTYSDKVPPPPGVTVAARQLLQDPNDEPQYGERVPYVIIRGQPKSRLVDRAVAPLQLLNNRYQHLDANYYISRVLIPPLERVFNLVGADVRSWYDEMPKAIRADGPEFSPRKTKIDGERLNIDGHFRNSQCLVCGSVTSEGICEDCHTKPQSTISTLLSRIRADETRLIETQRVCASCVSSPASFAIECESLDCPWLYERKKAEEKAESLDVFRDWLEIIKASAET